MRGIDGLSREERLRYFNDGEQVYGVRRMVYDEGEARGLCAYQVETGGGLEYEAIADRALDISRVRYRGVNINFRTKNSLTAKFFPFENDFVQTFPGGMLYTCGLLSAGGSCRDEAGQWHPMHGRIHGQAAERLSAEIDGGEITIGGVMRESALFGHRITMKRRITSKVGGAGITVRDTLTNDTPVPVDFMILYHMNFGYPFLSDKLRLRFPEGTQTTPRTEFAAAGMDAFTGFTEPADGMEEMCFFHDIPAPDGYCRVEMVNDALGMGARLRFKKEQLPRMIEWKSMASGDYALGMEPSNSYIMGRVEEQKNGSIRTLEAFSTVETEVGLEFFDV